MGRNPFVFVVGCPRSGTTLLRRILNAHPQLAIPKVETHWIPKFFNKRCGLTADGRATPELLSHLEAYHRFPRMGISRQELETLLAVDPEQTFSEFTGHLFDRYGDKRGKRLVGDKTPGYVRHIALLHGLFPQAKFVHLVRDGRDVCLSMLAWDRLHKSAGGIRSFAQDPVGSTALFWEWLVRLGRESGSRLSAGQYREVGYESLVTDPGKAARELCAFLGLPFERAMLEYHAGRARPAAGRSAKKAWLPPTGGLRDWRRQMPPEDVLRFEAVAGELLAELGYERSFAGIPADALDQAARLRSEFDRRPRPAAWRTGAEPAGDAPG
jgi:hypothetical protein